MNEVAILREPSKSWAGLVELTSGEIVEYTEDAVTEAYGWLLDCELPRANPRRKCAHFVNLRNVNRYYDGGLAEFLRNTL